MANWYEDKLLTVPQTWDEWVPEHARAEIESFWSNAWGRGPRAWLKSAIENGSPAYGELYTYTFEHGWDARHWSLAVNLD